MIRVHQCRTFSRVLLPVLLVSLLSTACDLPWTEAEERPLWGSGTIEGSSVIISAEVRGRVESLHAREGERRDAGEILVTIDAPELHIERAMRALEREMTSTEMALLDVGARQEDIRQAESQLRRAERDLSAARDDYERISRLLAAGSVTRGRYEDAELAVSRAETARESAVQSLERLRNLTRPEEYELARLRGERAGRTVDLAELNLDRTRISLPRAGWVDRILVEPGELVQPGQPVARIVDRTTLTLTVYIPQGDLSSVATGDRAEVIVDAWPDERFAGRITRIGEEAEFTPGNVQTREDRARLVFAVEVELPNEELRLRPGMGAEAEFPDSPGRHGRGDDGESDG